MRSRRPRLSNLLLLGALALTACKDKAKSDYEKGAKDLQPVYDAITKIRKETITMKEGDVSDISAAKIAVDAEATQCAAAVDKLKKVTVPKPETDDGMLKGFYSDMELQLRTPLFEIDCPGKMFDGELKCVESCEKWFVTAKASADLFKEAAKGIGKVDVAGIPEAK